jgi:hypothetical protein
MSLLNLIIVFFMLMIYDEITYIIIHLFYCKRNHGINIAKCREWRCKKQKECIYSKYYNK